jgi:hypothetical protein
MLVTVDDLKRALASDTDLGLAERLGVERSTIAQWRRRGSVPNRWHFVLKMKAVEAQSLAARRRIFGDGDGYFIQIVTLALLDPSRFDWPELAPHARGTHIQDWILRVAGYVIKILGDRTCNSHAECEALVHELTHGSHPQALKDWLYL